MSNLLLDGTLPYVGTKANTPPNLFYRNRQPVSGTSQDTVPYSVGDFWMYISSNTSSGVQELWYLASLANPNQGQAPGPIAKWVLISGTQGGDISKFIMDVGTAVADESGFVNIKEGYNTNTVGDNANTLRVDLNTSIYQPSTDTENGIYALGGVPFMHAFDIVEANASTYLGSDAGNLTNTGTANVGIGAATLNSLTTGIYNTGTGTESLSNLTSGNYNIAIGQGAGSELTTGSNNIYLSNPGGSTGESNTIRLGIQGGQSRAFCAGIYNTTIGGTPLDKTVLNIDQYGQIGQVAFISSDNSIAIAQDSAGVIDMKAVGGGGGGIINTLHADDGFDASASTVNIFGGPGVATAATGGNTVTINVNYGNYGSSFSQPFHYWVPTANVNTVSATIATTYYWGSNATGAAVSFFDTTGGAVVIDPITGFAWTVPATGIYNIGYYIDILSFNTTSLLGGYFNINLGANTFQGTIRPYPTSYTGLSLYQNIPLNVGDICNITFTTTFYNPPTGSTFKFPAGIAIPTTVPTLGNSFAVNAVPPFYTLLPSPSPLGFTAYRVA